MRFDTIIFDLDDTLLDTWGQLVQPAAREACAAMIEAGLAADLPLAIATREKLFLTNPRGDVYAALTTELGVRPGVDPQTVREVGFRAYFHRQVEPTIQLSASTRALLERLFQKYTLILVTTGFPDTQQQKVDLLGIGSFFQEVHYVHPESGLTKDDAFAAVLIKPGRSANTTLCVGDRPDREIAAGNRLGMVTVRVRGGEFGFLEPFIEEEQANYTLDSLLELESRLQLG